MTTEVYAMNLQIRDARARQLAEELAKRRGTTMTEAVIGALEGELQRTPPVSGQDSEKEFSEHVNRIYSIIDGFTKGRKPGRDMTKAEIDAMWGHE
ncbi:type II toxin-antitoxin system VapB family antitoxin [Mesorhizobium sp. CAU 1732]|uniref:type II toxin-antitoxin system VapB family antitoxin n=1 Tax=Mesorhizobium sp. CAU 1732 TaxID=3140358 RepID=UPI0032606825